MGSRVGFRIRDKDGVSQILRQQWRGSIPKGIEKMWNLLGGKPGNGGQALRDDLDKSRGFAAMVVAYYDPPFNSIEEDTKCDITDNGLIEIDISNWCLWKIYHYNVGWETDSVGELSDKTEIATMSENGFIWSINETERDKLGEGLD